ncbi:MAG: hypothetical protein ABMA26_14835 [Limisphaerales bacterium]
MTTAKPEPKPVRGGTRLFVVVIVIFVGVGVFRALLTPTPPAYGGKNIHEWWPEIRPSNADTNKPVAVAMRHMGTNTFPKIFSELRVPFVQPDDDWSVNLVRKLPRGWHASLPYGLTARAISRHSDAQMAFAMLGPERTNALPQLRRMVIEQGNHQAMSCLLLCGPEGAAVLLDQLHATNRTHLLVAVRALRNYQPQSRALMFRHVTAAEASPVHEAMRARITALAGHPDVDIRQAVAAVLVNSKVEWGRPLIDRLLTDPMLSASIHEDMKQLAWWEGYSATNSPPAKPAP